MTHIPLSELLKEDPKIVDVLYMLDSACKGKHIRNGPNLWAMDNLSGNVVLSIDLAKEIAKVAIAYRQFFRVMQIRDARLDFDYREWVRLYHETFQRCKALDKVEKKDERS
jgi:hypothetical protein